MQKLTDIQAQNELEFKRNKQNVYMRLTGNNKYYYADQCQKFIIIRQKILKVYL